MYFVAPAPSVMPFHLGGPVRATVPPPRPPTLAPPPLKYGDFVMTTTRDSSGALFVKYDQPSLGPLPPHGASKSPKVSGGKRRKRGKRGGRRERHSPRRRVVDGGAAPAAS